MVKRQITIKLQDQKFVVPFPNQGQIIDIEVLKTTYSQGRYSGLVNTVSESSIRALDFIDSVATFTVLIPEMIEKLNVENIFDIDPIEAIELVVQYKKVYFPFYQEILDAMKIKEAELSKLYEPPADTKEEDSN